MTTAHLATDDTFDALASGTCLVAFLSLKDGAFDARYAACAAAHPQVLHLKVRPDLAPATAHRFGIDETPAVLVVVDGTPIGGVAGPLSAADLAALVASLPYTCP